MTTTIKFDERKLYLVLDGMPELTGSAKQVEWASGIREQLFEQIASRHSNLRGQAIRAGKPEREMTEALVKTLNTKISPLFDRETTAKYWIDHRNHDLQSAK